MLKKTVNLFTTAYLLIIFLVYPFYMQNEYMDIGEAKNRFFLYVSIAAISIFGIFAVLYFGRKVREVIQQKRAYLIDWDRVSITDLFILLYATAVFLSYVFTDYRKEALWGAEGWYIGIILLLLLCGLYFFISRMWSWNIIVLYASIAASAIVFLLGICNRFSFYPISFETVQPDFISTLGNINWYCGYLSVTAPIGIGMFVLEDNRQDKGQQKVWQKWKRIVLLVYTIISFMTAFSQGSNSIFLWFLALFFMLLWICLQKRVWLQNYVLLIILWGASAQLIRLMRYLFPGRYNYDVDNLCGYFTDSPVTLWILLIGIVIYALLSIKNNPGLRSWEKDISQRFGQKILLAGLSLSVLICFLAVVINTLCGIPFLKDNAVFRQFFYFDENWGNGRGAAFYAGVQIYKELSPIHKLLGAGPDCFSMYAYSIPELASMLHESFGNARLTNAHNELLTGLVNTGLLGILFYLGIFITFIKKCFKKAAEKPILYVFAVCAGCYLIHNMVSFAQVLNLPFVFLLMGMGMAMERMSGQT